MAINTNSFLLQQGNIRLLSNKVTRDEWLTNIILSNKVINNLSMRKKLIIKLKYQLYIKSNEECKINSKDKSMGFTKPN